MPCQRCGEPAVGSEGICRVCGALATGAGRYRPPASATPPYSAQNPAPAYGTAPGYPPSYGSPYGSQFDSPYGPPYGAPAYAEPQGRQRRVSGLGGTLTLLLSLTVACQLGFAAALYWRSSLVTAILDGTSPPSLNTVRTSDHLVVYALIASGAGLLVCGILTICWFAVARANAGTYGSTSLTLGRGWAVAGWFIPLASLILPFLVLRDIHKGTTADPRGGRPSGGTATAVWWVLWTAWAPVVAASTASLGRENPSGPTERLKHLRAVAEALLPGTLLCAAAGIALIVVVRKITVLQTARNARSASGW